MALTFGLRTKLPLSLCCLNFSFLVALVNAAAPALRRSTHCCSQVGPQGSCTLHTHTAAHPKRSPFNTRGRQMSFTSRTQESNEMPSFCGQQYSAFSRPATCEPANLTESGCTEDETHLPPNVLNTSKAAAQKITEETRPRGLGASRQEAGEVSTRGHLSTMVPRAGEVPLAPAVQARWAEV